MAYDGTIALTGHLIMISQVLADSGFGQGSDSEKIGVQNDSNAPLG